MLSLDDNREMQTFAIQQLDSMLDESVRRIMASPELFLRLLTLTEYHGTRSFAFDVQQSQYRILQKLADNMNEQRAGDVVKSNVLPRILSGITSHNSRFQPIITNLVTRIVQHGRRSLDVNSLFALTQKQGASGALDGV